MSIQSIPNASFKPNPTPPFRPFSLSALSSSSSNFSCSSRTYADSCLRISASSSSSNPLDEHPSRQKKKLGVVVKPLRKPRLVLKFIWMEKDIGIALNQSIPGYGTIPLSPYYFWPRKDAWEELKGLLENKPWISELQRIHLLNQATDLINLWQTSGGKLE